MTIWGGEGVSLAIFFWLTIFFLIFFQKGMQKFKIIGEPLLGEKYVHGKRRKNNAKFSGHYVRPRMHTQRSCALTTFAPIW